MIELSYWENAFLAEKIEYCVLGAGIVGLQAAIRLKELEPEKEVAVLDKHPFPRGASTRNAGFACVGSLTELIDDVKERGWEEVAKLLGRRWQGLGALKETLGEEGMGYEANNGYEIFLEGEETIYEECRSQIGTFNGLFEEITGIKNAFEPADEAIGEMGFAGVRHLIRQKAEGQLHPGKMMQALVEKAKNLGIHLLFGWELLHWEKEPGKVKLICQGGLHLRSDKLLIATNGFSRRLLPSLDITPARNQVLLTAPIPNLTLKGSFHYHQGYVYFRNVGDRILIGGARHLDKEAEQTDQHAFNDSIRIYLKHFLEKHLFKPPVEIAYEWTGILGVGKGKYPILDWVDNNVLTAIRLGGMGVALGTQVGRDAAEKLLGNNEL